MFVATTDYAAMRRAMIDSQLRTSDVIEPRLLAAIDRTPREDFVPAAQRHAAYVDRAVPLGAGRALNPPLTTARLIDAAALTPADRVLLIGAATGYAAAVAARLADSVTAVEEDAALAAAARDALAHSANVTLVEGPLTAGAPATPPYDVLIIDGAVEAVPAALLDQLADGARVVSGLRDGPVTRLARGVHVAGQAGIGLSSFVDYECVALPGFAPVPQFTF